jgi:DNA helicase-2/ATP-dependent DNA helicase PcrA
MIYNEEQKSIIEETAHFVQVIAGAGSGKTSTMIGIFGSTDSK